jgi:hypothetical protein
VLRIIKKILSEKDFFTKHTKRITVKYIKLIFRSFNLIADHIFFLLIFVFVLILLLLKKQKDSFFILMNKFDDEKQKVLSMYHDTLIDPLKKRYKKKIIIYYYDFKKIFFCSTKILLEIAKLPPAVIFFDSLPNKFNNLSIYQIKILSFFLKSKFICVISDTCDKNYFLSNIKYFKVFDKLNIIDNPNYKKIWIYNQKNLILLNKVNIVQLVFDFNKFYNKYNLCFSNKKINCCFIGQINSYRDPRKRYLDYLLKNNISIYNSNNERANFGNLSYKNYYQILSNSKIGINFSESVYRHQLKARVWQLMICETMLLETYNDQITFYFEPGKDFIFFYNEQDLKEKINFYTKNDYLRTKIARNAKKKLCKLSNYDNIKLYI